MIYKNNKFKPDFEIIKPNDFELIKALFVAGKLEKILKIKTNCPKCLIIKSYILKDEKIMIEAIKLDGLNNEVFEATKFLFEHFKYKIYEEIGNNYIIRK